jgi:hypothetical protein
LTLVYINLAYIVGFGEALTAGLSFLSSFLAILVDVGDLFNCSLHFSLVFVFYFATFVADAVFPF